MNLLLRLRRAPSRTLLLVQLAAVLLYPWFDDAGGQLALTAISVGVLWAAIWMVRKSPRAAWIAALLAASGIIAWSAHRLTGVHALGVVGAAGYAAAFFYSAAALIAYMMQDERTTIDEMWAAGATFMLFAEAYAWVFAGMQLLQPGAFVIPGTQLESLSWVELLFLSATNFSATGLSDIYPGSPQARMLLVVEQWNGVMYLAVVVARLAGLLRSRGGTSGNA
ncbi:two pore domain potassium channel family protein [Pseudoxanthomonas helianthi]|uniref:Two pore domain potassium channel family protein n=1 Tax=Pseudoxanthomonas helianthi TaxID=1453541 RepID=A0A940WYT9_9GAMM|nr:two pore domain potassium channel family protein [Pseudoxanthomonas helianthi]MBP3983240.1 two pore domain potassium channel family protein [Pseudoxanthomonas helianthi]